MCSLWTSRCDGVMLCSHAYSVWTACTAHVQHAAQHACWAGTELYSTRRGLCQCADVGCWMYRYQLCGPDMCGCMLCSLWLSTLHEVGYTAAPRCRGSRVATAVHAWSHDACMHVCVLAVHKEADQGGCVTHVRHPVQARQHPHSVRALTLLSCHYASCIITGCIKAYVCACLLRASPG